MFTTWAQAIEFKCLRFISLPFFVMLSFAAELSSVATVSPPSSFEAFLEWLQSEVVHRGKPKKQKGRRVISKRQARRRERRLDVKFGAAFVHSPRGPRRGCTAKVSGNSGELRAVLIGPRPKRAPSPSAAFAASHSCSLAAPRLDTDVVVAPPTPMSAVLKTERRFMRRMKHRTAPRPSGCRPHRPNLLPTLNMPRRSRKAINKEQHALNGNTAAPGAGLHCTNNRMCFVFLRGGHA